VHRARVASRRLRELMPLLDLDSSVRRKLMRRLRKATVRLGKVRELDVLRLVIEELGDTGRYPEPLLRRLLERVNESRDRAGVALARKSTAQELDRVGRRLTRLAAEKAVRAQPFAEWARLLDARVAKRAASLMRAIEDAGAVYLSDRLHDVRVAVKKLRYALEIAVELEDSAPRNVLLLLKRQQTLLGRMHDLQVLIEHVRRVQAGQPSPDFETSRQLDALIVALDTSCRRLHARYVRQRTDVAAACARLASPPTPRPAKASRLPVTPSRRAG
jgi:CHAD domain-containing protein